MKRLAWLSFLFVALAYAPAFAQQPPPVFGSSTDCGLQMACLGWYGGTCYTEPYCPGNKRVVLIENRRIACWWGSGGAQGYNSVLIYGCADASDGGMGGGGSGGIGTGNPCPNGNCGGSQGGAGSGTGRTGTGTTPNPTPTHEPPVEMAGKQKEGEDPPCETSTSGPVNVPIVIGAVMKDWERRVWNTVNMEKAAEFARSSPTTMSETHYSLTRPLAVKPPARIPIPPNLTLKTGLLEVFKKGAKGFVWGATLYTGWDIATRFTGGNDAVAADNQWAEAHDERERQLRLGLLTPQSERGTTPCK